MNPAKWKRHTAADLKKMKEIKAKAREIAGFDVADPLNVVMNGLDKTQHTADGASGTGAWQVGVYCE